VLSQIPGYKTPIWMTKTDSFDPNQSSNLLRRILKPDMVLSSLFMGLIRSGLEVTKIHNNLLEGAY